MPLARYFLYVGGVLLTLLFIFDAYLTEVPVAQRAYPNVPVIRIHSDRKWPDRVVFDTSLPAALSSKSCSSKADRDRGGARPQFPDRR